MSEIEPTKRFSDRVDTYVRYRPSYPPEILRAIREALDVAPPAVVADIGAGTGIFSALLVADGFDVIAVEPNDAMREAALEASREGRAPFAPPSPTLARSPRFSAVSGTAEATGLPDASVDLVTAAQAFHWFDPPRARAEILRITRPPRRVALVWNTRSLDATPFLRAYEALLLRVSDDYVKVRNHNLGDAIFASFFGHSRFERRVFPSAQSFDREGFLGRALSSSYVPGRDHPRHAETVRALERLFDEHQERGAVAFHYESEVYLGCLA